MSKGMKALYATAITVLVLICGMCLTVGANASNSDKKKEYKYYTTITIEAGESLESLAEEYCDHHYFSKKQYMNEVIELNRMSSVELYKGMTLTIPYYSTEYK